MQTRRGPSSTPTVAAPPPPSNCSRRRSDGHHKFSLIPDSLAHRPKNLVSPKNCRRVNRCHKRAQLDMQRILKTQPLTCLNRVENYDHAFLTLVGVEPGVQLFLCVHHQPCISLMDALHCEPVANTAKSLCVHQQPCISLMDALHCKPVANTAKSPSGTPTVAVSPSPSNRNRFTITITPISSLERKIYTSTWRKLPIGWKLCAWIHVR